MFQFQQHTKQELENGEQNKKEILLKSISSWQKNIANISQWFQPWKNTSMENKRKKKMVKTCNNNFSEALSAALD